MTTNPDAGINGVPVDALLEELLREFMTGAPSASGVNGHESIMTTLADATMESFFRIFAKVSEVERAFLAEAFAPALVVFLSPTLARIIAPRIMMVLNRLAATSEEIHGVFERSIGKNSKSSNPTNGSRE
ncbi:MAG: hypothetical protein ACRDTC_05550 [Pseudonocardiaceae bacterium]